MIEADECCFGVLLVTLAGKLFRDFHCRRDSLEAGFLCRSGGRVVDCSGL